MTKATIENQQQLVAWATERIGFPFRQDAKAIGFIDTDGNTRCVVVFDGFSECDCNIHVASDGSRRWLNRYVLTVAFSYPFVQLGLKRVTGIVPTKNKAALNMDLRLGFEIEGRCKHALPDDDVYILGMLREQCPYIPQESRND